MPVMSARRSLPAAAAEPGVGELELRASASAEEVLVAVFEPLLVGVAVVDVFRQRKVIVRCRDPRPDVGLHRLVGRACKKAPVEVENKDLASPVRSAVLRVAIVGQHAADGLVEHVQDVVLVQTSSWPRPVSALRRIPDLLARVEDHLGS